MSLFLFRATWFWPILVVRKLPTMAQFPVVPVLKAAALRMSRRNGAVRPGGGMRLRQAIQPWFNLPLADCALITVSHISLNTFRALIRERRASAST